MAGRRLAIATLWLAGCAAQVAEDEEPESEPGEEEPADPEDGEPDAPRDPIDPPPVDPADPETCSAIEVEASPAVVPADIVWVIDNSGSMEEEEERVQSNMNSFAERIAASGIDYHVVMITDAGHVRVPAPLGGSDRLRVIDRDVDSHDALELIVQTYGQWQDFLRPGSVRHFVAVSDDESDWSEADFESALGALDDPGFPDGFVFHAIVAESPPWDWQSPCFLLAAAIGSTYIGLQEEHGGVFYSLCQADWEPVFEALSSSVAANASLPCVFDIPEPAGGDQIDFQAVNFLFTPEGGESTTIPYAATEAGCGAGAGWYYDDPAAPSRIVACPATCSTFETSDGRVDVAFGCATLLE